jgi:hypothetical protein
MRKKQIMRRSAIVVFTVFLLSACGGGSGTSSTTPDTPPVVQNLVGTITANGILPSMVRGKFTDDGAQYVVVAGWSARSNGGDVPVKIYKINNDATGQDVTTKILGSEQSFSVNYPVVADFNNDGIDDIFLAGFLDFPVANKTSIVFLSQRGQSHRRVELPGATWNHAVTATDINSDGAIDVINNYGQMWINDGRGNFTFKDHSWNLNTNGGLWMHGMGVCAGDFNNTGRKQIVITDLSINGAAGPIADTVIFELDASLNPLVLHTLPVPILDRNSATTERSHEVGCSVADLNNDGKLDLLVFSRPDAENNKWSNQGNVQVLINQGNWVFTDVTDIALAGYPTEVLISYTPIIEDLNGDGKLDLWLGYFDQSSGLANQAWINSTGNKFTNISGSTTYTLTSSGPMVPIKFGNNWAFVYSVFGNGALTLYTTMPRYKF